MFPGKTWLLFVFQEKNLSLDLHFRVQRISLIRSHFRFNILFESLALGVSGLAKVLNELKAIKVMWCAWEFGGGEILRWPVSIEMDDGCGV